MLKYKVLHIYMLNMHMHTRATQKHPLFVLPGKINEINITPHLLVKYSARAKAKEAAYHSLF